MRILDYGPQALLVECADGAQRSSWQRALEAARLPQVCELVPGERTILVVLADPDALRVVMATITALDPSGPGPGETHDEPIDLPVVYDGEDLSEAADVLGTSTEELIAWHSGQMWRCGFVGFMPGFGYLTPLDEARPLPRRSSPRTRVPAGSVGMADRFSGVYPQASPGGWQLIGRTTTRLWDAYAPRPPLISTDSLVRFRPVDRAPASTPASRPGGAGLNGEAVFEVLSTGPLALLQDAGRPGFRHWGVSRGGAADGESASLANRLVANPDDAAAVEVLVGGLSVRALCSVEVSVTGALGPVTVDGRAQDPFAVLRLSAGQELTLGAAEVGLRRYLAVAGGLIAEPELGSVGSSPTLGLGPAPLQPGQILIRGVPGPSSAGMDLAVTRAITAADCVVEIWPGPRRDWFADSAWDLLVSGPWTMTSDSDRVGIRLAGPQLERISTTELPSEPMVAGAIQVPPSGEPVIFGVDHPTTGGYPVIAVVDPADLSALGQCRPGAAIRFQLARPGW